MSKPKFSFNQRVKCIVEGSGHSYGKIYTVLNPNWSNNGFNSSRVIKTNEGYAFETRFVPVELPKPPEEWL